jgi:hypothetical protein
VDAAFGGGGRVLRSLWGRGGSGGRDSSEHSAGDDGDDRRGSARGSDFGHGCAASLEWPPSPRGEGGLFDLAVTFPQAAGTVVMTVDGHEERWHSEIHPASTPTRIITADLRPA